MRKFQKKVTADQAQMQAQPSKELDLIAGLNPEKGLILARMFRHKRMSYKYFWFLGLLKLVVENQSNAIPVSKVVNEMAVGAWHPVCFYRLSLGLGDALEEKVRGFHAASGLESKCSRSEILRFLSSATWATEQLQDCIAYVPTRLLQAHFQSQLEGLPDQRKDAFTRQLAAESQGKESPSMYWLRPTPSGDVVEMNDDWRSFMMSYSAILRSYAEYQLCQYLQSKNPHVPGIVNKLHATISRKLQAARKFWMHARDAFGRFGRPEWFIDIYTLEPLSNRFAIDHFLPWSFVAHDLMWNLAPVSHVTNSAKADRLPRIKQHLPRLASLHHRALRMLSLQNNRATNERLTPYAECFNMDTASVLKLSEAEFMAKYFQIVEPQERIARCQGFTVLA